MATCAFTVSQLPTKSGRVCRQRGRQVRGVDTIHISRKYKRSGRGCGAAGKTTSVLSHLTTKKQDALLAHTFLAGDESGVPAALPNAP